VTKPADTSDTVRTWGYELVITHLPTRLKHVG
jgi:hypothetical protein